MNVNNDGRSACVKQIHPNFKYMLKIKTGEIHIAESKVEGPQLMYHKRVYGYISLLET